MFPSPPLSFLREVVSVTHAVLSMVYISLPVMKKDLCSLWWGFLPWLQYMLTFWELSILRDVLECFHFHRFSFMFLKLYDLFWHGMHLKSWCRRGLFTMVRVGYLICNKFMLSWLIFHLPEGRGWVSAVSRSKEPFPACSHMFHISLMKPALPRHELSILAVSVLCSINSVLWMCLKDASV